MCSLASFIKTTISLHSFSYLLLTTSHSTQQKGMFGQQGNQLYIDRISGHYDLFPSLHTTSVEPVFQILSDMAIIGIAHDSVFGKFGHNNSCCSSFVDSTSSNSTTYGEQSPTFIQWSISCHSFINSPSPYDIESENSHDSHQEMQHYNVTKWSANQLVRESVFESMNRTTPYNSEEKKKRIERYRSKRTLRNFNKKIKYECRKTLADSRPRVRGRFARNDEIEKVSQPHWDGPFDEEDDYSWTNIIDALNKYDALISSF